MRGGRGTERDKDRETDRERQRQRQRETERERQRHTQREENLFVTFGDTGVTFEDNYTKAHSPIPSPISNPPTSWNVTYR